MTVSTLTKAGAVLSDTAKGRKTARQETTKALTKAEQTKLDTLVTAAKSSITGAETAERGIADLMGSLTDYKVNASRALALLSAHPAVVATGGPTVGQPALTKMAALLGKSDQSLTIYWKGSRALLAAKRPLVGKITEADRALVMAGFKSESARVASYSPKAKASKAKGGKVATTAKGTSVTFDSLSGQLDALLESLSKFGKDNGLTEEQSSELFTKLDGATDMIEQITAK